MEYLIAIDDEVRQYGARIYDAGSLNLAGASFFNDRCVLTPL
jgi:hypothetical protein